MAVHAQHGQVIAWITRDGTTLVLTAIFQGDVSTLSRQDVVIGDDSAVRVQMVPEPEPPRDRISVTLARTRAATCATAAPRLDEKSGVASIGVPYSALRSPTVTVTSRSSPPRSTRTGVA